MTADLKYIFYNLKITLNIFSWNDKFLKVLNQTSCLSLLSLFPTSLWMYLSERTNVLYLSIKMGPDPTQHVHTFDLQ